MRTADKHGNVIAQEGVTRCPCGAKYWENDVCVSCGAAVVRVQRVGRPLDLTLGDWVSADGLAEPVYLSDEQVDGGGAAWYGCGDEHPYSEEGEHCGTVGCHGRPGDDR